MENDNNNNTNSDNKKKGEKDPKGPVNSYWTYAILIAFLFGINLVMSLVGRPEEVTFKKFEEIARAEDISKLNVVNKQDVEIFIKKEKLDKYPQCILLNKFQEK